MRVRVGGRADAVEIAAFLTRLSDRTVRLRYMMGRKMTPEAAWAEAMRMVGSESPHRTILVASTTELIGLGELVESQQEPRLAEIALVVRDDHQGVGHGTALLGELIRLAGAKGITALRVSLLAENRAMRRLIARTGLPTRVEYAGGSLEMVLDLTAARMPAIA
ncbi:MAG: GNAT family N-acetyltransferase [Bacillota bacterium]